MRKIRLLSLFLALISTSAFGYGVGTISYPMLPQSKFVGVEMTGITSTGGGVGIQGRYTQKINSKLIVDAGAGLSGGQREARIFAGSDFELFPDYQKQPKVSVKAGFEHAKEFDVKRNILSIAPTVSKGFNFWGHEAFPYLAVPVGLSLNDKDKKGNKTKSYETIINANLGISGNLPIENYEHLVANLEASIDIKDSFTGIFLGLNYPLP